MGYRANLKGETAKRAVSVTRREADQIAAELRDDFEGVKVIRKGSGYAVELIDGAGFRTSITSIGDLRFIPNHKKQVARARSVTRREADKLVGELVHDFAGVRVIPRGSGYAVEVLSDDGHPNIITSVEDLRFMPNRRASRPITRLQAQSLADELRMDYSDARVTSRGGSPVVEVILDDGSSAYVTSQKQLRFLPNFRKNGRAADLGFLHDAKSHDFLRPANRQDMLKSLQSRSGVFSEAGRSVYVKNDGARPPRPPKPPSRAKPARMKLKSWQELIHEAERDKQPFDFAIRNPRSGHMELICEGLVEGFMTAAFGEEAQYMEPLEEVREFVAAFYSATSRLNRFSLGDFFDQYAGAPDPEIFGYYIAMQAAGTGVSWWDDNRVMRSGSRHKKLTLPDVEASGLDGGELYLGMDADRLNHVVRS